MLSCVEVCRCAWLVAVVGCCLLFSAVRLRRCLLILFGVLGLLFVV